MSVLRYVTHPNVLVDPDTPVPHWRLNDLGRARVHAMLSQPWVPRVQRLVSSGETKAIETASILAGHLDLDVDVRPDTGEIDRTSRGYVSSERHESLADRWFSNPAESAEGWERAVDAQSRIVGAVADLLDPDGPSTVVVGHGGVGTLLYCHLMNQPIARRHDQPGQGHYWSFDVDSGQMLHGWRAIDDLDPRS